MGFRRRNGKPQRQLSRRQRLLSSQRACSFIASAFDKPQPQFDIPEKRARAKPSKPAAPSEHQVQAAVIDWWGRAHSLYQLPEFSLFAIPNGGARDAITGSMLKAEGVRPGVLDLQLAKPVRGRAGLFIELKVGYNKPSPEQQAFIAYLDQAGYKTRVCWDSESAIAEIKSYLEEGGDKGST